MEKSSQLTKHSFITTLAKVQRRNLDQIPPLLRKCSPRFTLTVKFYEKQEKKVLLFLFGGLWCTLFSMSKMKALVKALYRKFFYQTLKRVEQGARSLLFGMIRLVYPRFNAFRVFGVPAGIERVAGEEIIAPLENMQFTLPKTIEKASHERFHELDQEMPGGRLALLRGGFSTATGASLSGNGRLIPEFTQQFTMNGIYSHKLFNFRKERFCAHFPYYKECVASLIVDCQKNYFHFLYDVLPKVHLIQQSKYVPEKYYVDMTKGFQKEMLQAVGIDERRVIQPDEHSIISADSLIATTFPAAPCPAPWVFPFLQRSFLGKAPPSSHKRIFISRRDAIHRRIVNEGELLPFLERHGFTIHQLEKYSVAEQAALFHGAEIILAPHGAGLANLAFCNPKAQIVEIFAPRFPCVCYWKIANLLNVEYHYFKGEERESTYSPINPGFDDIYLSLEKLQITMDRVF